MPKDIVSALHAAAPEKEAVALTEALRMRLEAAVMHTATTQMLLNDVADIARRAFDIRAWEQLGHPDWQTYCDRELFKYGGIRWTPEQRLELIVNLRDAGLSFRAISAVARCNPATACRNWRGVAGATPDDEVAKKRSRGLDGKRHPARRLVQGRNKATGATSTGPKPQPQGSVSSLDEKGAIPDAEALRAENAFKTRFGNAVALLTSQRNIEPLNEAIWTLAESVKHGHFQRNRSDLARLYLSRIQGQINARKSQIDALQRIADALEGAEGSSARA